MNYSLSSEINTKFLRDNTKSKLFNKLKKRSWFLIIIPRALQKHERLKKRAVGDGACPAKSSLPTKSELQCTGKADDPDVGLDFASGRVILTPRLG